MSAFEKDFVETTPPGSALANTLDTVIQDFKTGLNERYELEHNALDASGTGQDDSDSANAQGRHLPGRVACTYIGTTTEIAALTGMVKGSLAYDTDLGILKLYNGTNWTTYTLGNAPLSGTELLVSIFGSAVLAAAGMVTSGTWTTAPANVVKIFDRDDSTSWDDAVVPAGTKHVIVYWDLGAIYQGHIMAEGAITSTGLVAIDVISGYNSTAGITLQNTNSYGILLSSASATPTSLVKPFLGRYVGMKLSTSSIAGTFAMNRFEVFGSAV